MMSHRVQARRGLRIMRTVIHWNECDASFPDLRPITLCASSNAATMNHSRHHVIFRPSHGWAYAAPRPRIDYDDTPSYDDRSKFGGDQALPVTR
jgi:hypothetical protein